jgi:CRP-like cAMP-binding protein
LQFLEQRMTRHEYEVGETVFSPTSKTEGLYIIDTGVASVTLHTDGRDVEVARIGPGDALGESGILSGMILPGNVTALTKVVVFRLGRADLTPILKARPEVAQQKCRVLSKRRATVAGLLPVPPLAASQPSGLFGWLRDGMRRLHELTS